jgi:hypothetical protein
MHTNPSAYFRRDVFPAIADARRAVSQFLGASDDGLGFVRNSTEAINTVLSSHRLQPGDESSFLIRNIKQSPWLLGGPRVWQARK